MKTPREIFLDRHRSVEPALDEIRQRVVSDLTPHVPNPPVGTMMLLWTELILPCRRVWAGLAAVWVVILALDFQMSDATPGSGSAESATQALLVVRQEDRRIIEDLIEVRAQPMPAPTAPQRPRSEMRNGLRTG